MAIQIGKIVGIPIALDYSWFVIFLLIAWTVGFNLMPITYPGLSNLEYASIGLLSSTLLFASVLIHELAHSIVAKRNGIQIRRITLFLFGGVSEIAEEPGNPSLELRVAIAGPLTSVALALISALLWQLSVSAHASALIQAPFQYSMLVNGVVAGFNLIPAFPMDGGRVLRSLLWRSNGDIRRSTITASRVGRAFAYIMIFGGVFAIFYVDVVTGLWLILIGWFMSSGAQGALGQTILQLDLQGVRAAEIMTRTIDSVTPDLTLDRLSLQFINLKHNGFPVVADGQLVGCVTAGDLRKVKGDIWPSKTVREIMTPREKLVTMNQNEAAKNAVSMMNQNRIGRIFVLDDEGKLAGIITRTDVLRIIQAKEATPFILERFGEAGGIPFTAELGMYFTLQQPNVEGFEWVYESNPQVQLISEGTDKDVTGRETKRFTFQAKAKGRYVVKLILVKKQQPEEGGAKSPVRTVTYLVTVN
jgi:Zn-dependent protease/CBS domain-containing protein